MTGAAVASAAVGVTSMAKGFSESKKAGEAGDSAIAAAQQNLGVSSDLNAQLAKLGAEGVEMAQGLMDEWEGTFGGIQDNLATYYQELDPTKYSASTKANYAKELDKSMQQYNETMASQGLQTSGMKQQTAKEAAFKQAEANSAIDIGAEDKVRGMQQGFVNTGEGQRSQATNALTSAQARQGQYATTGANALMTANRDIANAYSGQAQGYGQSAAGFAGAGGSMLGSALGLGIAGGAFNSKPTPKAKPQVGSNVMKGSNGTTANPSGIISNGSY